MAKGVCAPLLITCLFMLCLTASASRAATTFSYTLDRTATTSAGVYSSPEGILVRTLWFNVKKEAGAHTETWDNLDDDGKAVASSNYEIRVLVHHMEYRWDGLVGNNSSEMSGTGVHKGMYPLQDIAITGSKAFYTTGYNEGMYDFHRFDTAKPRERLDSWTWVADTRARANPPHKLYDCYGPCWAFVAADSAHVYFASAEGWDNAEKYSVAPGYVVASNVVDDTQPEDVFAHGVDLPDLGTPYVFPHGIRVGNKPGISGMAVQQKGNILAVAVAPDSCVYLIDKHSGDVLIHFDVKNPARMTFATDSDLWIAAGENVYCYKIAGAAPYDATLTKTIPGFSKALAVGMSPKSDLLVVADGGASQQLKAFSTDGVAKWTYGQEGGYQKHGPKVTDDKLWFYGFANIAYSKPDAGNTFITFEPDGTFWVGDGMNARTLKFAIENDKLRVVDRISMQPMSYLVAVDQANATRVFRNFLEFKVDYSKPLGPDNGSWTLTNNWAANLPTYYATSPDVSNGGLSGVVTMSNGRTYAQINRIEKDAAGALIHNGPELVELTADGIRPTGRIGEGGSIMPDGSLFSPAPNHTNGSFETGDTFGWAIWTSGAPKTSSATARNTPGVATDGKFYLDIQATGAAAPGATIASTNSAALSVAFAKDHTFTLTFDARNKQNGFDQLIVSLLSADSLGKVTASAEAAPPINIDHDDAWHSYKTSLTLPKVATESSFQLRMSWVKSGADPATTYEAYLDNVKLTQGREDLPLIEKGNQRWVRAPLIGFDDKGNPNWGPWEVIATLYDPAAGAGDHSLAGVSAPTASGIAVYEPSLRNIMHLGGVRPGLTKWAWCAFPSIDTDYNKTKTYPIGYYDLGTNHKVYTGGNTIVTSDHHIIAGYHGEGWGRCQGNQFMHFYDDGLFVGEFGVSGTDASGQKWAPDYSKAGYAGNAFSPALAKHEGELYLYINDEWGTPLQRFHLVGANDIREIVGVGAIDSAITLKGAGR